MSWHMVRVVLGKAACLGFVLGAAGAAHVSLSQAELVRGHLLHNLQLLGPAILAAPIGTFWLAKVVSDDDWSNARWAMRGLLVLLAFLAWRYHAAVGWREILAWAGLVLGGWLAHHVAHRHALGWIWDRGERQKVEHWNRGHAIFTPTTRSRRIIEEVQLRSARRKRLFWLGLLAGAFAFASYRQFHSHDSELGFVPSVLTTLCAFPCLWDLFVELLYLSGYQDMQGHRVLDPEPVRPGLQDVISQRAHGDATVAEEREAHRLLGGG